MTLFQTKCRLLLLAACLCAVPLTNSHSVSGQFKAAHVPEGIHVRQMVNLYFEYDGPDAVDGAYLAFPLTWRPVTAQVISPSGRRSSLRIRPFETFQSRFTLVSDETITEGDILIIRTLVGANTGPYAFRLTPLRSEYTRTGTEVRFLDEYSLREPVEIEGERLIGDNRVLQIDGSSAGGFPVPNPTMEFLGAGEPFTVELWIKTTSTGSVLLSTWTGDETESYPIELVTDALGHVVVFRGAPGEHRSMRSSELVADGAWHHIAVVHDPERMWNRLLVDGMATDSLAIRSRLPMMSPTGVVVGDRLADDENSPSKVSRMTGQIDELRIWHIARNVGTIRRTMRQPLTPASSQFQVWSFDESVQNAADRGDRVRSDLSFYEPIRQIEVERGTNSVLLSWEAPDQEATSFSIERSKDGVVFDPLGVVERHSEPTFGDNQSLFAYQDHTPFRTIAFYRIRQHFEDGTDKLSPPIKLGLGDGEDISSAVLDGNFPNPFNPSTTVMYTVKDAQHVQVSVWDLAGQRIAILVDEFKTPGQYEARFDAGDLPSGSYFVRMNSTDGVLTHQMILMK